jgi:voltage-gated sodium channel
VRSSEAKEIVLSVRAKEIVRTQRFENLIYVTIIAGCVLSGVETYEEELGQSGRMVTKVGDAVVITIFCVEASLKICSTGREPMRYFHDYANQFDFAVTVISLVLLLLTSGAGTHPLIFSLFRLFRCLELISHSRKLRWICAGFTGGIKSILYIIMLLSVVLFVYAVTGVFYFGRNDPFNFGSFRQATISLLKLTTLDDWRRIFYANFFGCNWSCNAAPMFVYPDKSLCVNSEPRPRTALLYFGSYIVITPWIIVALFVGSVLQSMETVLRRMQAETEKKNRELGTDSTLVWPNMRFLPELRLCACVYKGIGKEIDSLVRHPRNK